MAAANEAWEAQRLVGVAHGEAVKEAVKRAVNQAVKGKARPRPRTEQTPSRPLAK
jgi:hypothetical protein